MFNLNAKINNKKILIYGFGKSGQSTYNYLKKLNKVLIFDDYEKDIGESRKFLVGSVVDEFLAQNKYYSYLIEFRGHLFDKSNKEKNAGVLVVSPFELFKQ